MKLMLNNLKNFNRTQIIPYMYSLLNWAWIIGHVVHGNVYHNNEVLN